MDDRVWHHSTFTKNRDRLLEGEVAHQFFAQVLEQARAADLLSEEHFSVDGTLIEALASLKSYRPKDEDEPPSQDGGRNPTVGFRGEKRRRRRIFRNTSPLPSVVKKWSSLAATNRWRVWWP